MSAVNEDHWDIPFFAACTKSTEVNDSNTNCKLQEFCTEQWQRNKTKFNSY